MSYLNPEGSKVINFGKFTGIIYPEIYYQFVSELHNHHPDLLQAMVLAKVKLEDGSARDFLNIFFQTDVKKDDKMEVGFSIFYGKLMKRKEEKMLAKKVSEAFKVDTSGMFKYRPEEDAGKPLFPSIEEQIDRGDK